MRARNPGARIASYSVLFVYLVIVLVPLYWLVVGSLLPASEMYSSKLGIVPRVVTALNYIELVTKTDLLLWFWNSLVVSAGSLLIGLFICSLTGYVFAIYNFRFKNIIFWSILGSVSIPVIVLIIPVYRLMIITHLLNTFFSLILPYSMNVFGIFFLKQFVQMSVPRELIDSARVDGAGEFLIYYRIAVPLSKAGLGVLSVFLWLNSWINYFWPLIMIRSRHLFTLPLGLATLYANPYDLDYGQLLAGSVIATLPIVILFVFVQDTFVSGITLGAVKD